MDFGAKVHHAFQEAAPYGWAAFPIIGASIATISFPAVGLPGVPLAVADAIGRFEEVKAYFEHLEEQKASENAEASAKEASKTESESVTTQPSETINPPGTEVKFDPVTAVETNQSIEVKTPQEGAKSEPGIEPPPPPPPPEPKNTPGMGM